MYSISFETKCGSEKSQLLNVSSSVYSARRQENSDDPWNKNQYLLTTSRVQAARNVEQPALFRATLSLKRDVEHGVTANSLPGYSTMQTFTSYQMMYCT